MKTHVINSVERFNSKDQTFPSGLMTRWHCFYEQPLSIKLKKQNKPRGLQLQAALSASTYPAECSRRRGLCGFVCRHVNGIRVRRPKLVTIHPSGCGLCCGGTRTLLQHHHRVYSRTTRMVKGGYAWRKKKKRKSRTHTRMQTCTPAIISDEI